MRAAVALGASAIMTMAACAPAPGTGATGTPCSEAGDCAGGMCIPAHRFGQPTGWPAGYCTAACSDGVCPEGAICASVEGGARCLAACADDSSCRTDYRCSSVVGACLPDCRGGWRCGDGWTCGDDGACHPDPGSLSPRGAACSGDASCQTGICFSSASGWPNGLCADVCTAAGCGPDGRCVPVDGAGWCLTGCVDDSACREGYLCQQELGACFPDCRSGWSCGDGRQCGEDGHCQLVAGALAGIGEQCEGAVACASGICFESADGWPAGLCADACVSGICPEGAVCAPVDGVPWCLPACSGAAGGGCRSGYVCNADFGVCLPDCALGWDCGPGYECGGDGRCAPAPYPLAGFGMACTSPLECGTGVCFGAEDGWQDGMCSAVCDLASSDAPCAEGGVCVPLDGVPWCVPGCGEGPEAGEGCRPGYVCNAALAACLPDCALGWECAPGFSCGADGLCAPTTVVLAGLGEECDGAAACASGICFSAEDGWPAGLCAAVCVEGQCGDGGACVPLSGVPWCLPDCQSGADCRSGYLCNEDLAACLPDCTLGWDCGPSFECGADGECHPKQPPTAELGLPCGADADCGGDTTCKKPSGGPGPEPTMGVCSSECTTIEDCPPGGSCVALWLGSPNYCLPSCGPEIAPCFPPLACNPMVGACLPGGGPGGG